MLYQKIGEITNIMENAENATTATFLKQISSNPDSLVARKHGLNAVEELSRDLKRCR